MKTQLRIGHFSPDAPAVNISVDDDIVFEDLSVGTLSDYLALDDLVDIDGPVIDIELIPASGGDAVLSESIEIDSDRSYTLMAIGMLDDLELRTMVDDQPEIDDGDARVRFVHAAADAPAVDVMANETLMFEDVAFGETIDAMPIDASTWDIDVRVAGSTDSVLSLPELVFEERTSYTMIASGTVDDETLDVMLVADYVWTDDRATLAR